MDSVGHYSRPEYFHPAHRPHPASPKCADRYGPPSETDLCWIFRIGAPDEEAISCSLSCRRAGCSLLDDAVGVASRRGGAGPTDHKAVTVLGTTIMAPVHTRGAADLALRQRRRRIGVASRCCGSGDEADVRDHVSAGSRNFTATEHGGWHSVLETRATSLARHARDDGAANVRALRECGDEMPVLRDRRVAESGPHHRAKDARATCRGRRRRATARWHKAMW